MGENKDIERSKGNLWLIIVTGKSNTVHREVEDYRHANRIIRQMILGPKWKELPDPDGVQFFTPEDVEANSVTRGKVYQNFDGQPYKGRSFVAYLLDDYERYNYLIKHFK
jgi:hypothetical protein